MRRDFRLKPESEDMLTLDCVRFLAASGIVIMHSWQIFCHDEGLSFTRRLDFFSLFVDVFFIISGFVIASLYAERVGSIRGYFSFMQKRLARLAPLHWATLSFYCAVGLAFVLSGMHNNYPAEYDWGCVLPHALFLHAFGACPHAAFNAPSWSISAEMALYLIFPLFLLLGRHARFSLIWISLATLAVMYLLSGGANGDELNGWTNWTTGFGAVRGLAGFTFGMTLYMNRRPLSNRRFAFPLLLASFVAFLGLGMAGAPPMWVAPLAYAIALFAVMTDLAGGPAQAMRRVAGLGQLTYSIYMLHYPVHFIAVSVLAENVLHLRGIANLAAAIFSVLLVLPAAWLSLILFERPARKWIGQLGRAPSAPVLATASVAEEQLVEPLTPAV